MIQEKFGNKVRMLRNKRQISQEQFAFSIHMDRSYFSSVEAGKRNISLCNIKKIADGLEVSLQELFEDL